jgi:exoribonuclease R
MFPPDVAYDLASLSQDRSENIALTFAMTFRPDGAIDKYRVAPSRISNVKRINYNQADSLIRFGQSLFSEQMTPMLQPGQPSSEEVKLLNRLLKDAVGEILFNICNR